MSFKLQITDEMARFMRSKDLDDALRGQLLLLLLDAADGEEDISIELLPQPLKYTYPIFVGQIAFFRENYERKIKLARERQRERRARLAGYPEADEARDKRDVRDERDKRDKRDMRDERDERDKRDKRDERDTCDNACHAPYHTNHTRPNQTISSDPNARARARLGASSERIGVDSYDVIFSPENDPVELAVEFCLEEKPRSATSAYRRQLTRIGDAAFRQLLAAFWGEVQAGEDPDRRGAAFMARLKREETFDRAEADEARRACAALSESVKGEKLS